MKNLRTYEVISIFIKSAIILTNFYHCICQQEYTDTYMEDSNLFPLCDTCIGKCGSMRRTQYDLCSCDRLCMHYSDCCADFNKSCPVELSNYIHEKIEITHFSCLEILVTAKVSKIIVSLLSISFVDKCKTDANGCDVQFQSQSTNISELRNNIPVEDLNTNILYVNLNCAICNGVTQMKAANLTIHYKDVDDKVGYLDDIKKINSISNRMDSLNQNFTSFVSYGLSNLGYRLCDQIPSWSTIIRSCPDNSEDLALKELCEFSGTHNWVGFSDKDYQCYQNSYCALCNIDNSTNKQIICPERCFFTLERYIGPSAFSLSFLFDFNLNEGLVVGGINSSCMRSNDCDLLGCPDYFYLKDENCEPIIEIYISNIMLKTEQIPRNLNEILNNSIKTLRNALSEFLVNNTSNENYQIPLKLRNITNLDWETSNFTIYMEFEKRIIKQNLIGEETTIILDVLNKTYSHYFSSYIKGFIQVYVDVIRSEFEYTSHNSIKYIDSYVTIILCFLSCVFLLFRIYLQFSCVYLNNYPGKLQFQLCLALLFMMISIPVSPYAFQIGWLCNILAAMKMFSFLASFTWMTIEAIVHWTVLGPLGPFRTSKFSRSSFIKYTLIGWITPSVYTIFISILDHVSYYIPIVPGFNQGICWFFYKKALVYYFGIPFAIASSICFVFFFLTLYHLNFRLKESASIQSTSKDRSSFRIYFKLFCLHGITWIFGMTSFFVSNTVISMIFIVSCCSQGIFITLISIQWKGSLRETFSFKPIEHSNSGRTDSTTL